MATILRKLPLFDAFTTIEVQGRTFRVFPYQIVLWVSLGPVGTHDLNPRTPRFPAILDPGFTDNVLIHKQQLQEFAGLEAASLRRARDDLRASGRRIPLHAANLWVHANRPGERDRFADRPPVLLELHRGIGVCSDSDLYPRLPLLGARALRQSRLRLDIDYGSCRVSLSKPGKLWFLAWRS